MAGELWLPTRTPSQLYRQTLPISNLTGTAWAHVELGNNKVTHIGVHYHAQVTLNQWKTLAVYWTASHPTCQSSLEETSMQQTSDGSCTLWPLAQTREYFARLSNNLSRSPLGKKRSSTCMPLHCFTLLLARHLADVSFYIGPSMPSGICMEIHTKIEQKRKKKQSHDEGIPRQPHVYLQTDQSLHRLDQPITKLDRKF